MKRNLLIVLLILCLLFEAFVIQLMGKVIEGQRLEIRELYQVAFPAQ